MVTVSTVEETGAGAAAEVAVGAGLDDDVDADGEDAVPVDPGPLVAGAAPVADASMSSRGRTTRRDVAIPPSTVCARRVARRPTVRVATTDRAGR